MSLQVSMLMQMRLLHVQSLSSYKDREVENVGIEWSRFRLFDKFVKMVIGKNPVLDTQRYLESVNFMKLF